MCMPSNRPVKKRAAIAVALGAALVLGAWFLVPRSVDRTLTGVLWRDGDPAVLETVNVEICGQSRGAHFWGDLSMPEMGLRAERCALSLGSGFSWLREADRNVNSSGQALGAIVCSWPMRRVVVLFEEELTTDGSSTWGHIGGEHRLLLCAPCTTREEAVETAAQLCGSSRGYRQAYQRCAFS